MFTGIVQSPGAITNIEDTGSGRRFSVQSSRLPRYVKPGSSVSVSGVCLTVAARAGRLVVFDVIRETWARTTLGRTKIGDEVNLEPSLRLGDELGGHFVYGHVDGVGEIVSSSRQAARRLLTNEESSAITIKPPKNLSRYIVPQGSIAVDGVSLTIARVEKNKFTVALVPYTLEQTTLGSLKKGDRVNLEADVMAKYCVGKLK